MNISDRQNILLNYIMDKGEVTLKELFVLFPGVSQMTVRRDLELLEQNAQIRRFRGGVSLLSGQSILQEPAYAERSSERSLSKNTIATKAVALAAEAKTIYIDSGTTCEQFAAILPNQSLFVLTPAPIVALNLAKHTQVRVNLTGGQLNRDTLSLAGNYVTSYIKTINFDYAFMGTSAFSLKNGFTCGDYQEAELKKRILRKAKRRIILMDISKINYSMPYTFAKPQDIDILVCDQRLPGAYMRLLQKNRVELI